MCHVFHQLVEIEKKKRIETATNTIAKTTNFVSFVMKKVHAKL